MAKIPGQRVRQSIAHGGAWSDEVKITPFQYDKRQISIATKLNIPAASRTINNVTTTLLKTYVTFENNFTFHGS